MIGTAKATGKSVDVRHLSDEEFAVYRKLKGLSITFVEAGRGGLSGER
jgi:hypothetical protein